MVFSYTAPEIDEDQSRAEYEALSDEERQAVRDRLYGDFVVPEESEYDMIHGPGLLQDALDLIPNHQKEAYMQAVERAPELVERESNSRAFMRAEKYNAWAAARRLVEYWKMRKLLFGETRAFLPMTLEGAMAEDVETLRLGITPRLPNDDHGRPVFFGDRIRCVSGEAPKDAVLRSSFYTLHAICQDEAAQNKGYVVVASAKNFNLNRHFDRMFTKRATKMVNSCMPAYVCAFHLCCGPGQSVLHLVMPVLRHIYGKTIRMHLLLHSGSDRELLEQLELFGMNRKNLSTVIGGTYSQRHHEDWLEKRLLYEQQQPQPPQQRHANR